jgi:hypothetical protein
MHENEITDLSVTLESFDSHRADLLIRVASRGVALWV